MTNTFWIIFNILQGHGKATRDVGYLLLRALKPEKTVINTVHLNHCDEKQDIRQRVILTAFQIKYFSGLFFCLYMKQTMSFRGLQRNALPFPSSAYQHTQSLHFPKFREGFSSQHLYLPHQASHSSGRDTARNALWGFECSLDSSCQWFYVSDFSQGTSMLIHFTLLTHLFFFRLFCLF